MRTSANCRFLFDQMLTDGRHGEIVHTKIVDQGDVEEGDIEGAVEGITQEE